VTAAVLVAGTVVTGTGPHAGDPDKNGRIHRIHLSTSGATQLHADLVMVLVGLTLGLVALTYALSSVVVLRRSVLVLLGVVLAQGVIGYTQYFLHVPALLVGFHMLGACLVWLAALRVLFTVEPRAAAEPAALRAADAVAAPRPAG
jgi:cytochrome c oxidase assembly protein subunit 15